MSDTSIIDRLRTIDVYRSAKYTARALLDLVDEYGHIRIEYDAALTATELTEVDTLRAHLSKLKGAGLLTYHLNGAVEITFDGFPSRAVTTEMLRERASTRGGITSTRAQRAQPPATPPDPNGKNDPSCALSAQICDASARECDATAREASQIDPDHYISHAGAPTRVGWLVGINDPNTEDTNQPTNPPETETPETILIDPVEAAQSYALLVAIRMKSSNAKRYSEWLPFATIRQFVARWWFGRKSKGGKFGEDPGIVTTWLAAPDEYPLDRHYPLAMLADVHAAALTATEHASLKSPEDCSAGDEDLSALEGMDDFERRQYWMSRVQQRGGWTDAQGR